MVVNMANTRKRKNSVFNQSSITRVIILTLILQVCSATWSTTPGPYYQRFNDGSYNYGYNAGGGYSARQSGTAANEVSGQYSQLLPDGKLVNVRYNAGVGGFRPQLGPGASTTARPYGFSYNTGDAFHQAVADQSGNVRGNYWYRDPTGRRNDLRYRAGPGIGFVPTGGSLAIPNGLGSRSSGPFGVTTPRWNDQTANAFGDGADGRFPYVDPETSRVGGIYDPNGANSRSPIPTAGTIHRGGPATGDGSYNFGYQTPDSARQEGSDARGNVHGAYSFRNGGGNHDLAYVAGPGIGFQPTGGTLARPNGLGYGRGSAPYGNANEGGRVGSGATHPSGGINNAPGTNGHSGLGHGGVGYPDPSYNAGDSGNIGAAGQNGGSGSSRAGPGFISGTAGQPGSGSQGTIPRSLGSRGGVIDGDAASGLGSTGDTGHGLNSAGANVGGNSGGPGTLASGTQGLSRAGGLAGDGSSGTGLGLRSTNGGVGQSGLHGHNNPNLANSNAARGFGGQGYGSGASNGINRPGGHYHPDSSFIGNGRGQNAFSSGLPGNAGLSGSPGGHHGAGESRREEINDNDGNAKDLQPRNFGTGSSASNLGGFGSRGIGASGSGYGINGQNGVGDHQRLGAGTAGTPRNGGYSYGTPAGSSTGGSGTFGSSGSGSNGINAGGHSAGLSVEPLQSTGSGLQSSGSSSSLGSTSGVVSGEQHDLQRNAELEQSIQAVGGSSATKGISKR
uniref:Uncharacterized protein n=2 Tax=Culex tarsalis TaxID=7177 RepID=A0A1Q3FPH4_CULTA